jgi:endonuclease/exonuclease/phosphatase (EEP) superfamily protein YafD
VIYSIGLPLLTFILFPFLGERNVTTAFFLYLPRVIFLLPALVVIPYLWFCHSGRAALFTLIAVLISAPSCLGYRFGSSPSIEKQTDRNVASTLRLVSYNRGQHQNQSLRPFLSATSPNVIILQEAQKRAVNYTRDANYSKYPHIHGIGEFVILSQFEVLDQRLVIPTTELPGRKTRRKKRSLPPPKAVPIAARFVVRMPNGDRVSVYSVHTLTPRDALKFYARGGFILGVAGFPGSPLAGKRREQDTYWDARLAQLEELVATVTSDPLPSIIAGDFNVPVGGVAYRILRRAWDEAHADTGSGVGYTFPGVTRNPLSLGGPWMRLDHIFFDQRWRALETETEADRPSQHRAIFATLQLES